MEETAAKLSVQPCSACIATLCASGLSCLRTCLAWRSVALEQISTPRTLLSCEALPACCYFQHIRIPTEFDEWWLPGVTGIVEVVQEHIKTANKAKNHLNSTLFRMFPCLTMSLEQNMFNVLVTRVGGGDVFFLFRWPSAFVWLLAFGFLVAFGSLFFWSFSLAFGVFLKFCPTTFHTLPISAPLKACKETNKQASKARQASVHRSCHN